MPVPRKKNTKKRLFWSFRRRVVRRQKPPCQHYLAHKELARQLISARVHQWNQLYGFQFNRIAIRNQRTCWGSCTSLKNLNFSYKLIFLPEHLQDYIVAHELCHLQELHHEQSFWDLLGERMPDYQERMRELRSIEAHFGDARRLPRLVPVRVSN